MKLVFVLFLVWSVPSFSSERNLGSAEFEKIMAQHWEKKDHRLEQASFEIRSDVLRLEDYTASEVKSGTAFGAKASVLVRADFKDVQNYYEREETLSSLDKSVPTIKEINVLNFFREPSGFSALAHLIIKVPVLSDIPVTDRLVFEKFNKYGWLKWYQDDEASPLLWNRGCVVIEPYGKGISLATVYGIHVMKADKALSWLLRPAGSSFAIQHYTNYLLSLRQAVSKGFLQNIAFK